MWAFACALATIFAPAMAFAYAPMCDENAQTIDAPAPIYPSKPGTISATQDCGQERSEIGGKLPPDPSRIQLSAEAIDRALASGAPIPPCIKSSRLRLGISELGRARPGNHDDVFRPPRG